MSNRSRFIAAILSVGVLSVALSAGAAQQQARALEGDWQVTQLAGQPVPDDVTVTMRFDAEGRVSGKGGCNRYSGTYVPAGDALTFGPVAMTRMACPGEAMRVEARFSGALEGVTRAVFDDAGILTLSGADGGPLVVARPDAGGRDKSVSGEP